MTVCNMTIEGGGRAGMIAPDETTFDWVIGPPGGARRQRARRVARAAHRRRAPTSTREIDRSTPRRSARWSPGGPTPGWSSASPTPCPQPASPSRTSGRSHYMGLEAGTPIEEISARPRVHRLVHQLPDRRPAGGRRAWSAAAGSPTASTRWSSRARRRSRRRPRPRAWTRSSAQAGFDWRGAGCSMCLGMNPDIAAPGERVRLDLEPQLRGPPGARGPLAPGLAPDGRRGGDRGPFRRHPRLGRRSDDEGDRDDHRPRQRARTATTSTPTRSSPSSSSSGSSGPASASSCSTTGPRSRAGTCRAIRSWSPGATSAAAPAASTPRGRWRTTASRRSSRRASPTSSAPTAPRSGCCRSQLTAEDVRVDRARRARPRSTSPPRRCAGRAERAQLRDRPRDQAPAAQRARRHRADARSRTTRIAAYERERERSGPVTTAL